LFVVSQDNHAILSAWGVAPSYDIKGFQPLFYVNGQLMKNLIVEAESLKQI
jgi:hypothetical protein